jgi:hypothetical protein
VFQIVFGRLASFLSKSYDVARIELGQCGVRVARLAMNPHRPSAMRATQLDLFAGAKE